MQITGGSIQLQAQHSLQRRETHSRSLEVWQTAPAPAAAPGAAVLALGEGAGVAGAGAAGVGASTEAELREDTVAERVDDLKMRILALLLERLTGQELQVFEPEDLELDDETLRALGGVQRAAERARGERVGWGAVYREEHTLREHERLEVRARGRIRTEDGRTLDLSVELKLDRRLFRSSSSELRLGDARIRDPLVVDFGAPASRLPGTRFAFDLDMDGSPEDVPLLSPGSAFLVDDRDGDGIVDDGSELFGPRSGDGFAELAALDHDGSGFIDAGDPAWSRLRIWEQTPTGDRLVGLGARGIGALYVGSVTSPFAMMGAGDETLGQLRETGIWIGETGGAGTVRQIDLSV